MIDPSSPIYDLYGSDAPIDPNGKHLPWLWVLLLPFVDEKRVVQAFNEYKIGLTVDECRRNAFGASLIFLHSSHKLAIDSMKQIRYRPVEETDEDVLKAVNVQNKDNNLLPLIEDSSNDYITNNETELITDGIENKNINESESENKNENEKTKIIMIKKSDDYVFDHINGDGISGKLSAPPMKWFLRTGADATITAPPTPPPQAFHNLLSNQVICLTYQSPIEELGSHKSQLLSGVILQESVLTSFDLMSRRPPRLNRGGFNIVELALGIKNKNGNNSGNQNHILKYGGNHDHGGDGSGHYPNQRQFSNNNNNNYNNNYNNNNDDYNNNDNNNKNNNNSWENIKN